MRILEATRRAPPPTPWPRAGRHCVAAVSLPIYIRKTRTPPHSYRRRNAASTARACLAPRARGSLSRARPLLGC